MVHLSFLTYFSFKILSLCLSQSTQIRMQCLETKLSLLQLAKMVILTMILLVLQVFPTVIAVDLLQAGESQPCIVKDNCFRTPPNPYIAANCYADVINTASVSLSSKRFQLFGSSKGRDALTIQRSDTAKSNTVYTGNTGPDNLQLFRGDRFVCAFNQRSISINEYIWPSFFVLTFDFTFLLPQA